MSSNPTHPPAHANVGDRADAAARARPNPAYADPGLPLPGSDADRREKLTLPYALTAAALTSFLALYFNARGFALAPFPAVPALFLVATYFVKARLPDRPLVRWVCRALVLAGLFTVVQHLPTAGVALWYFEPEYTRFSGAFLAAEFCLRAWTRYPAAKVPRAHRIMLFLTGLVMTAASNTFERVAFNLCCPLYALCVALTLRDFACDAAPPPVPIRTSGPRARKFPLALLRGAAVTAALLLGAATTLAVTRYDNALTTFAFNLLRSGKAQARGSAIGFSSAPHLTAVFNPDPTVDRALVIDGPAGERHVRILAFDTYDRSFWRPPVNSRPLAPVGREIFVPPTPGRAPTTTTTTATSTAPVPTHTLRITRLVDLADLLAVPTDAVTLRARGDVDRDPLDTFHDANSGEAGAPYEVTVPARGTGAFGNVGTAAADVDSVPLAARPTLQERFHLLTVPPEIDPRVSALARELTANDTTPAQKIFHLARHLRTTHEYSLSFEPQRGTDPLNDFILNRRAAHCQYFASALVMLARAAGVPARLVTGYYAHETYGDDQTVVRERDAHAWAECYLDDVGQWVTADATPASGRPDGLFPDPPRWRRFFEYLRDLPARLRSALSSTAHTQTFIALAIAAALILLAAAARNIKLRRRRAAAPSDAYPAPPAAELRDAAARFERWLRAARRQPPVPHKTWRDQARALADADPRVLDFLNTYDAARFGPTPEHLLPRLRTALAALESSRIAK